MSRAKKIAAVAGAAFAGLVLVVFVAGVIVVRTQWFRDTVRAKMVSAIEEGTGGRTEVGSFNFDWTKLRATVRGLVIHGLEPAEAAPLFRAELVQVDLKLTSPFKSFIDIAYLLVDRPSVDVIVYPDGHTNVPSPKTKSASNKSGLETVVDLAIKRFDLRSGAVLFAQRASSFNASGENLRAQLAFNTLNPSYSGEIDMSPLYLKAGGNQTVNVNVKLPLKLQKDRIALDNASLATSESQIFVTAAMEHLADPRTSAHVNATVALAEVKQAAGLAMPLDLAQGPRTLNADITASMSRDSIDVQNARVNLGQSTIEAAGPLQASGHSGALRFNASLAVAELGKLLQVAAKPEGTVRIAGDAALKANSDYLVSAAVDGRDLAFSQNGTRLSGIGLSASVTAAPNRVDLARLQLAALGGQVTGAGAIENMEQFRFAGNLQGFDIGRAVRTFSPKPLGYGGVVSGPIQAAGSLKNTSDITARANLSITPVNASQAVPVSGRVNVDYSGRGDTVAIAPSYVQLPHTRVDVSGSLGQQIQLRAASRDFTDFKPLGDIPVTLNNGSATVEATVSGKLSDPRVTGHIAMNNFATEGRAFSGLAVDLNATKTGASVTNASLTGRGLQAYFSGTVGLHDWSPEPSDPLNADLAISNGDVQDILALAGQANPPATGSLTANAHITGTVGSPVGNADLSVSNGAIQGEHFDSLTARVAMSERSVDLTALQLIAGPSRLDATASYAHPANDLKRGSIRAHVASNQVQLAQFQSLVKDRPGLHGTLNLTADAEGLMQPGPAGSAFQLTSLTANTSARGLGMENQNLGDLTATAQTSGQELRYNLTSNFAGSDIRIDGQSQLAGNHATTAAARISNLRIEPVLALAGSSDLPVTGVVSASAQVNGTIDDPHVTGNFTVANGSAYRQPFTQLQADLTYTNQRIDINSLRLADGPATLQMTASLAHPPGDFQNGQLQFHVSTSEIQLERLRAAQSYKPGLAGAVEFNANGAATLKPNEAPLFSTLNANLAARRLSVAQQQVGDVTLTSQTQGRELAWNLASNFGGSDIRGGGKVQLAGDYPVDARLTFNNVTYSGVSKWTGEPGPASWNASTAGEVTVNGPVARTADLKATLRIQTLEAHPVAQTGAPPPRVKLEFRNQGDVLVSLDRSVVAVRNFRIAGPGTTLAISGSVPLEGNQPMDLRADGNIHMKELEAFSPDIFADGSIVLNAVATGTAAKPTVKGSLRLQNVAFNTLSAPNGIANANGAIAFTGSEALIQNITADTGGGKLTLSGNVGYGGPEVQVRVRATADKVRVNYPETVSTQATAKLALNGTATRSLLSGDVTILDVALHSHSDIGSMLSQAATPPSAGSQSTGFLAGMRFDVKIVTAPNIQFRTTLTENLKADANLRLRGSPDNPGMLGRVGVTQGNVIFFGSKYSIDQGTLTFNNPQKINPIVNLDLETNAQGVDVSLSVTGPMDRLKLSYHSDPPMLFSDLVSLLASGKTPTTDPVLAAHEPAAPQQNFEQAGMSAVLGQAVANPLSGRLQRLFGVSKLKIDPQITGSSSTPQATMTLQQQITKDLTFTYIQDVTQTNPQAVRIEWAINQQWSAIAQRDVYGIFDLDFFYKKRFK